LNKKKLFEKSLKKIKKGLRLQFIGYITFIID